MLVSHDIYFDWKLFWIFFFVALPGLLLSLGGFTRTWWPIIESRYKNPGKTLTVAAFGVAALAVVVMAIVTGIVLAPTVNARFIYFQSILNEKNQLQAFLFEFLPGLFFGLPSALIYLFTYYAFFRKHLMPQNQVGEKEAAGRDEKNPERINEETVFSIERFRNRLGLGVRLFFNATVGEVVYRWGFQSLLVFLFFRFTDNLYFSTIGAIVLTAGLSGFTQALSAAAISRDKSRVLRISVMVLETGISIVFGVLFWRFGIAGAITAHVVLYLVWHPLDIFYFRKIPNEEPT